MCRTQVLTALGASFSCWLEAGGCPQLLKAALSSLGVWASHHHSPHLQKRQERLQLKGHYRLMDILSPLPYSVGLKQVTSHIHTKGQKIRSGMKTTTSSGGSQPEMIISQGEFNNPIQSLILHLLN